MLSEFKDMWAELCLESMPSKIESSLPCRTFNFLIATLSSLKVSSRVLTRRNRQNISNALNRARKKGMICADWIWRQEGWSSTLLRRFHRTQCRHHQGISFSSEDERTYKMTWRCSSIFNDSCKWGTKASWSRTNVSRMNSTHLASRALPNRL